MFVSVYAGIAPRTGAKGRPICDPPRHILPGADSAFISALPLRQASASCPSWLSTSIHSLALDRRGTHAQCPWGTFCLDKPSTSSPSLACDRHVVGSSSSHTCAPNWPTKAPCSDHMLHVQASDATQHHLCVLKASHKTGQMQGTCRAHTDA